MSIIDTKINIGSNAATVEKIVDLSSQKKKSSDQEKPSSSSVNNNKLMASYSLYGSHNERVAIVFKNDETGRVVCEIPTKYLQELHTWLEEMEYKLVDERI